MVLIIIEKSVPGPDSGDKSLMVDHAPRPFGGRHAFEKVMQFIYQIVFIFIHRFPEKHLLPERYTMIEDLDRRVCVANIGRLYTFIKIRTYIFKAQKLFVFRKFVKILVYMLHSFEIFLFLGLLIAHAAHAKVLIFLLFPR
jgi:hypothetical protein